MMASRQQRTVDTPGTVAVSSPNATQSREGGVSVAEVKFSKESWQRVLATVRKDSKKAIEANEAWRMKSARLGALSVAASRKTSA